jgi:hypothetical protein
MWLESGCGQNAHQQEAQVLMEDCDSVSNPHSQGPQKPHKFELDFDGSCYVVLLHQKLVDEWIIKSFCSPPNRCPCSRDHVACTLTRY